MDIAEKRYMRALYEAIKNSETALGFDEKRGVGVIALLDERGETQLVPVAEIQSPVLRQVVNE
jgi:hypothetical protein